MILILKNHRKLNPWLTGLWLILIQPHQHQLGQEVQEKPGIHHKTSMPIKKVLGFTQSILTLSIYKTSTQMPLTTPKTLWTILPLVSPQTSPSPSTSLPTNSMTQPFPEPSSRISNFNNPQFFRNYEIHAKKIQKYTDEIHRIKVERKQSPNNT